MAASPIAERRPIDAGRLREIRCGLGLSQEVVAHRTGLCLRTVAYAESRGIASRRTLDALAGVLRVRPEELSPQVQHAQGVTS